MVGLLGGWAGDGMAGEIAESCMPVFVNLCLVASCESLYVSVHCFDKPVWNTKLVVIKRGEALNPRVPVVYLGFESRSVHDGTVKPTAKYVDECLDIVQLQNKSSDDAFDGIEELKPTRRDDSVRSSSTFSVQSCCWKTAVHYRSETGSDVCDKMPSPTLADLTRAKKVLKYLKGTRELNLYLTIPALKPNELNKTLKHIVGYSDADWPVIQ